MSDQEYCRLLAEYHAAIAKLYADRVDLFRKKLESQASTAKYEKFAADAFEQAMKHAHSLAETPWPPGIVFDLPPIPKVEIPKLEIPKSPDQSALAEALARIAALEMRVDCLVNTIAAPADASPAQLGEAPIQTASVTDYGQPVFHVESTEFKGAFILSCSWPNDTYCGIRIRTNDPPAVIAHQLCELADRIRNRIKMERDQP